MASSAQHSGEKSPGGTSACQRWSPESSSKSDIALEQRWRGAGVRGRMFLLRQTLQTVFAKLIPRVSVLQLIMVDSNP